MIRVLIADDHPVVRRGLRQLLSDTNDIMVTGEAGNSGDVLNEITKHPFDIILLDGSGLVWAIHRLGPTGSSS